jgi:mono/diheme cytochrome c family protein
MKTKVTILLGLSFLINGALNAQEEGAKLFKQNCGVCHTVGKGKLVGPDLKGSHERYKEDWLMKWIRSSQTLVKKGDATAVKLFEENNKLVMPDQTIPDADIKTILAFVKTESEKPVEVAATEKPKETAPSVSTDTPKAYDYHAKETDPLSWKTAAFVLGAFCLILVIVIIGLGQSLMGIARNYASLKYEKDHPTIQKP